MSSSSTLCTNLLVIKISERERERDQKYVNFLEISQYHKILILGWIGWFEVNGLMGVVDDESNITCFGLSDKRIPMTDEMCLASTTISPSVSPTVNEFAVF